jgi:ubiquinone/menaquinone biosynthesis C-methylase UbiE
MSDDLQAFYGRWAGLYDRIARFPGVGAWRVAAADALALDAGDTVVEMGCGTGANFPHVRERIGPEGTLVGVDLTAGMLAVAATRIERRGWENVSLVRADAARPPIGAPFRTPAGGEATDGGTDDRDPSSVDPANTEAVGSAGVDAVLASFVVGMFAEPEPVVERWASLVRPGGRLCLLDAARSSHPIARPFDLAFRGFVVASTPPTLKVRYDDPPWAELDRRVDAARGTLAARCPDVERTTHGLGFVHLAAGTVR